MSRIFRLYRGIVILSVGILVLLGVAFIFFSSLQNYDPKALSLAYRLDSKNTLLFFRTDDLKKLEKLLSLIRSTEPSIPFPDTSDLPSAESHEFALQRTSSGSSWIIYSRISGKKAGVLTSSEAAAGFLPFSEMRSSLARTKLFARLDRDLRNLLWIDLSFPFLPPSDVRDLVSAGTDQYKSLLVAFEKEKSGSAYFEKKIPTRVFNPFSVRNVIRAPNAPLIEIRSDSLFSAPSEFFEVLSQKNPNLSEGLFGIWSQYQKKLFPDTGREELVRLFRAGGTYWLFGPEEKPSFLISGGGDLGSVRSWLDRIKETGDQGVIRKQNFMNENTRVDVIGSTGAEIGNFFGWEIRKNTGLPSGPTVIAAKGAFFTASDEEDLLKAAIAQTGNRDVNKVLPGGALNVRWFSNWLNLNLPFLGKDSTPLLKKIFEKPVYFVWEKYDENQITEIRWKFEIKDE